MSSLRLFYVSSTLMCPFLHLLKVGAGMEKKEAKAARRAHVMEMVEKNDFEGLLKLDELTREVIE